MNRFCTAIAALTLAITTLLSGAHPSGAVRQDATPAGAACAVTSPAENEALVARWYDEAINGRDLAVLDEILAPDLMHDSAIFPENPHPAVILGQIQLGFPDVVYTVNDVISADDKVVVRWSATGTNDGELFGNAPTGATVTWTGINIFQVECGLISAVWSEIDGTGRAAQLRGEAGPATVDAGTPSGSASPVADCAPLTPEENAAIASRWFTEAANEQDLSVLDEILAAEARHDPSTLPGDLEPREVFAAILVGFPDVTYTIEDVISDGDMVVIRTTATGTNEGEFLGHAATGQSATWTGINIFQLACGQIINGWNEIDSLGRAEQLGLLP